MCVTRHLLNQLTVSHVRIGNCLLLLRKKRIGLTSHEALVTVGCHLEGLKFKPP